jgi:hypothetical protein
MEKNKNTRAVRMVTIATVRNPTEARRIKAELESAGLQCDLRAEAALADQWLKVKAGGIKVQVGSTQARRAIEILAALGKSENFSNSAGATVGPRLNLTLPGGPWVRAALGILSLIVVASLLSAWVF